MSDECTSAYGHEFAWYSTDRGTFRECRKCGARVAQTSDEAAAYGQTLAEYRANFGAASKKHAGSR